MKYILSIFLSSFLFFFPSCHKKEALPVNKYTLTLKKDGVSETLLPYYCAIQPNTTMPSVTDFMIVTRSNDFKVTFAITIQVTGNFTTGVYETTTNSGSYPVIADYFMNQGEPNERDYTIDNAPGKPNCSFVVTITSIDDKEVKGTFSGNYLYDRANNESIILSDGSFIAKRHN